MNKATVLLGVMALTMLQACSPKTPPEQQSAPAKAVADDEEKMPPPGSSNEPTPPPVDRPKEAAGLMPLLDTSPKCQQFRDQLEAAGRTPADQPLPVSMAEIVAKAHEAGCSKQSGQP